MKKWQIFGINVAQTDKSEVLDKIKEYLADGGQHYFITINPEILLHAGEDEEYFYILNHADMAVPDGVGLKFAAWACFRRLKIIPGADFIKDILSLAATNDWRVGILNWAGGLSHAAEIKPALEKKYPRLNFFIQDVDSKNPSVADLSPLAKYQPQILFVTFGAPDQEKFIWHNLKNLPTVKLAVGVGGSFDYISGTARRAPWLMRKLGLEWLWRMFGSLSGQKKGRKKRIYNAVIRFTAKFLEWRFILPWLYRPNVCSLLYKKENGEYKFLIVKRSDWQEPHWQLPQGGIDKGEDLQTAGARELREEAGTDKFKQIAVFKNLWRYEFGDELGKYQNQRHVGYRGQKQSLFIAEFTGEDQDIKINFWDHDAWQWVGEEKLIATVFPVRRTATEIYLKKFQEIIKNRQEN